MKRILVPYDFSECADNALKQAAYLAERTSAELMIYHIAPLHPYWEYLSETDRASYLENINIANKISDKLDAKKKEIEISGIKVITKFTPGPIIENIVNITGEYEIDLLVIGTHGMSGVKEWMLGSNTQKILRQVDCPVLTIKHDLMVRDFARIGFVTSLHHDNDKPFDKMLEFAAIFEAEIILINMDEPGFFSDPLLVIQKALKDYQSIAVSKGFKCTIRRMTGGGLEKELTKEIVENDIDLIVIPTHGKNAFVRIFINSIAEAIVNHLDKPVMTIRIA